MVVENIQVFIGVKNGIHWHLMDWQLTRLPALKEPQKHWKDLFHIGHNKMEKMTMAHPRGRQLNGIQI